jgi:hypothetical protein
VRRGTDADRGAGNIWHLHLHLFLFVPRSDGKWCAGNNTLGQFARRFLAISIEYRRLLCTTAGRTEGKFVDAILTERARVQSRYLQR